MSVVASTHLPVPAIHGGPKAVEAAPGDLFTWPIVMKEDEEAVLEVLRRGAMSGLDVTRQFEKEFAEYHDVPYALAHPNGTAAILAGLWALGVRQGDEIIAPTVTYWASALPALGLGATVNFADIDPKTICIAPKDIESRIGPRTKVIVVVHYCAHPCDMDPIMEIARKHKLKVLEDVSHAHGGRYKGRMLGTIGDVACFSLMSGKSLAAGEGGMLVTKDREVYERAVAWGHYERTGSYSKWATCDSPLTDPELRKFAGLPLGGCKNRLNQLASAFGRVQLKHYPKRIEVIQRAMNRFWDLLEGTPGVRAHRVDPKSGSTMAGWYSAIGLYEASELGGVPIERFCDAVRAEGVECRPAGNQCLHVHPLFHEADIYGTGRPSTLVDKRRDVRQGPGTLPNAEAFSARCFSVPWFKHDRVDEIERYALAYKKASASLRGGN